MWILDKIFKWYYKLDIVIVVLVVKGYKFLFVGIMGIFFNKLFIMKLFYNKVIGLWIKWVGKSIIVWKDYVDKIWSVFLREFLC